MTCSECKVKAAMEIWIGVTTNYYQNKSGYTTILGLCFESARAAKGYLDSVHRHEGDGCDYCRGKWKKHFGGWIRKVDYDGAYVTHEVRPITLTAIEEAGK